MVNSVELMQFCRLCLVKDQVNIPIFEEQGDVHQIFLKISACLPVKVSREDNLPKKICGDCSYKLDLFYQFWNTSANSEKQLLAWLNEIGLNQDALGDVGLQKPESTAQVPTNIILKQEAIEPEPDPPNDGPGNIVSNETQDYILQQQQLPYQASTFPFSNDGNFGAAEASTASGTSNAVANNTREASLKRKRQATATVTQPESEEDDDDDGVDAVETKVAKTEETSDDDRDDDGLEDQESTSFAGMPSTSTDNEQPGPSGMGKNVNEAPSPQSINNSSGRNLESTETTVRGRTSKVLALQKLKKLYSSAGENKEEKPGSDSDFSCNEECESDESFEFEGPVNGSLSSSPRSDDQRSQSSILKKKKNGNRKETQACENISLTKNNNDSGNNEYINQMNKNAILLLGFDNRLGSNQNKTQEESKSCEICYDIFNTTSEYLKHKAFHEEMSSINDKKQENCIEIKGVTLKSSKVKDGNVVRDGTDAAQEEMLRLSDTEQTVVCSETTQSNKEERENNISMKTEIGTNDQTEINETMETDQNETIILSNSEEQPTATSEKVQYVGRCVYCDIKTYTGLQLKQHLEKDHNKNGPYKCATCDFKTINYLYLNVHFHRHHKDGLKRCYICNEKFGTDEERKLHLNVHRKKCDECKLTFASKEYLKMHKASVHGNKKNVCEKCNATLATSQSLAIHYRTVHGEEEGVKCEICDKNFKNRTKLQDHKAHFHNNFYMLCDICGKNVKRRSLYRHKKTHSNVPNALYKCKVCGKEYKKMCFAKCHDINKKYKCHMCDKAYFYTNSLKVHLRIHTGEKPYACSICDRSFKTDQSLFKHKLSHMRKGK